ncbi:Uma2 family endonuclease [Synechococcus sp. RC10A2]|uniref:Uma2 family endonuclease n=1 Tax=Synechococcus sp. RC10A2 TaxID=2964529 RepID=UPI0039C72742
MPQVYALKNGYNPYAMATQTATAQPKRKKRTQRQDTPQPCPDPIAASLQQLQSLKLPTGDGDRMESDWHVVSISLLDELVRNYLGAPTHYFCGGNMFLYYSIEQAKEIEEYVEAESVKRKPRFKGPDFFLVKEVDGTKPRDSWVVWEEDGRYPDLVVEFISTSTRKKDVDRNVKFYAKVFRVPEYFWFDRRFGELVGYRLVRGGYERIEPNERGWLWSEVLGAYLGVWVGEYRGRVWSWLRLWDRDGQLVLTREEREARAEARAAEAEAQAQQERAERERLQAELAQLMERLRQQGVVIDEESQP